MCRLLLCAKCIVQHNSIGPNSDAMLDRFNLGDELLPHLHRLLRTVCNTHWEVTLRSPPWNLTYKQASNLVWALCTDLQGTTGATLVMKPKFSILNSILKLLGITTLLFKIYMSFQQIKSVAGGSPFCHLTMVSQVPSSKRPPRSRLQLLPWPRTKVILSKQVRATLNLSQQEKAAQFKKDLDDMWWKIDEVTKTIAATHSKSMHCVETDLHLGHSRLQSRQSKINSWNTFCWKMSREKATTNNENAPSKRQVLPELVKDIQEEYCRLSVDAKQNIVEEFSEFKETKAISIHVSAHSRINNVTHTLKAVESKLNNLKSCTSVESILYTTCGTTDLPLRAISFATKGVEDFIGSVMHVDTQDLVSKMEGFLCRESEVCATKNHYERLSRICTAIHEIINCKL
ncbi:hypothetical protein PAXRUDRAFT_168396, partial [Paxillus rubicundulus Ve08.2h10]